MDSLELEADGVDAFLGRSEVDLAEVLFIQVTNLTGIYLSTR